jgi:NDP-sugar pyrophosphorylase family protein
MKAMIFAAGLGTRLRPLTDTMPKALVSIGGKPLLEHVIEKLKAASFDEIIINVHHFSEQIVDFLRIKNNFGIRIAISDESDSLLETGGGIRRASWFFDDGKPFLVHNVDILSNIDLQQLYTAHLKNNSLATLAVSSRNSTRYLLFDNKWRLQGWRNSITGETRPQGKKLSETLNALAFSGIQVLSPQVFELMHSFPEKFSIIDFYLKNLEQNQICGFVTENQKVIDVGKFETLKQAEEFSNQFLFNSRK